VWVLCFVLGGLFSSSCSLGLEFSGREKKPVLSEPSVDIHTLGDAAFREDFVFFEGRRDATFSPDILRRELSDSAVGTEQASVPILRKVTSTRPVCPGVLVAFELEGTGFVENSRVYVGDNPVPSTFVSTGKLRVELKLSKSMKPYQIYVVNPPHLRSNHLEILTLPDETVGHLQRLEPSVIYEHSTSVVTVKGSGFSRLDVVVFDGVEQPTEYVSSELLRATVEVQDKKLGHHDIWVWDFVCKEKTNALQIFINGCDTRPVLDRIFPFSIELGTRTTLSIYGSGFRKNMSLLIGKQKVPLRYKSSTYSEADLDLSKVKLNVGDYLVYLITAEGIKSKTGFPFRIFVR
jgi:hypothetical protein